MKELSWVVGAHENNIFPDVGSLICPPSKWMILFTKGGQNRVALVTRPGVMSMSTTVRPIRGLLAKIPFLSITETSSWGLVTPFSKSSSYWRGGKIQKYTLSQKSGSLVNILAQIQRRPIKMRFFHQIENCQISAILGLRRKLFFQKKLIFQ